MKSAASSPSPAHRSFCYPDSVTRRIFLAVPAALACPAWPQKKKPEHKLPDLEILKISSQRQEGSITYEGDVKVSGEKPITGLVLRIEFFESRGDLLTMQKIVVDDETIPPGGEKHFLIQGKDVPRAVSFRIAAVDRGGRDLSVARPGPYLLD
jgi:hypothetical protein